MYNLIDLGQNQYKLTHHKFGTRIGGLRDVVEFAVFDLGFEYIEIERALVEMNKLDHNGATFGVFCGFIFTFKHGLSNVG